MPASGYETYQIELVNADGNKQLGTLNLERVEPYTCNLELSFAGRTLTGKASDFFEAFCQIRLVLEAEGIFPLCNATIKNAYPAGIDREMGSGLIVTKRTMGRGVSLTDKVKTFETDGEIVPATVSKQRAFLDAWLVSMEQLRSSKLSGNSSE